MRAAIITQPHSLSLLNGHSMGSRPPARSWAAVLLLLAAARAPPAAAVKLHVWTNTTDESFVYPELSSGSQFAIDSLLQKPSLGIAFSGGGSGGQWRAAALTYGWLRALYLLNVTDKAQYISANSAASWVAVPYAYTTAPLARFFSPYFEPNNLTVPRLSISSNPGSWAQFAAGKSLRVLGNPMTAAGEPSSWANHLAAIFLAPFGLGSSDSSVSAAGTKGDLLRQTKKRLPNIPVHVACTNNRPYPITTAAIMTDEREVSPKFFPFEHTPLYSGMPALAAYNKPTALGGGFVESLGLNSAAPRKKVVSKRGDETVDVTLNRPTGTSSLVHMVGISSSQTALTMQPSNRLTANLFNGEMLTYWNLWDYKAHDYVFVDGAAVDDLAIMPLLRRGVKNIIACVATRADPTAMTKQEFATAEFALAALFGAVPLDAKNDKGQPLLIHGVDDAMTTNDIRRVFHADGFDDLFAALTASHQAGGAHVITRTYEVLHNTFMGVAGGYQATVMWVLHGRSSQWEAGLAEQTQRWLARERNAPGPYQDYPFTQHTSEAPGPLISLLSQQASWSFRTQKAALAEFVAAAAGSSSGPAEEVIRGNEWR